MTIDKYRSRKDGIQKVEENTVVQHNHRAVFNDDEKVSRGVNIKRLVSRLCVLNS